MASLARTHILRVQAEKQSASRPAAAPAAGSQAERMAALMSTHQAALKTIKSRTAKIEAKRGYLDEYAPYVDGVLAADNGGQDDVLVTVMVWRVDTGDLDGALAIAEYALRHGLSSPPAFARDVAATVLEEIADGALIHGLEDSARVAMVGPLTEALSLTAECDMPDEVRAKGHKALGLAMRDDDPEAALEHLRAALRLDPRATVKAEIAKLEKALADKADA